MTSSRRRAPGARGLLPLLRAAVSGGTDFDQTTLTSAALSDALACGLGPLVAHVANPIDPSRTRMAEAVRAADLAARVLSGAKFDLLEDVLSALACVQCTPVLLKGAATALQYYPAPHLRTMGDIDILVSDSSVQQVERQLLALGFEQR